MSLALVQLLCVSVSFWIVGWGAVEAVSRVRFAALFETAAGSSGGVVSVFVVLVLLPERWTREGLLCELPLFLEPREFS